MKHDICEFDEWGVAGVAGEAGAAGRGTGLGCVGQGRRAVIRGAMGGGGPCWHRCTLFCFPPAAHLCWGLCRKCPLDVKPLLA